MGQEYEYLGNNSAVCGRSGTDCQGRRLVSRRRRLDRRGDRRAAFHHRRDRRLAGDDAAGADRLHHRRDGGRGGSGGGQRRRLGHGEPWPDSGHLRAVYARARQQEALQPEGHFDGGRCGAADAAVPRGCAADSAEPDDVRGVRALSVEQRRGCARERAGKPRGASGAPEGIPAQGGGQDRHVPARLRGDCARLAPADRLRQRCCWASRRASSA